MKIVFSIFDLIELIARLAETTDSLDKLAPNKPQNHWMRRHQRAIKVVSKIAYGLALVGVAFVLFALFWPMGETD